MSMASVHRLRFTISSPTLRAETTAVSRTVPVNSPLWMYRGGASRSTAREYCLNSFRGNDYLLRVTYVLHIVWYLYVLS